MAPKGVKRAAPTPAGGARKKTNADPVGPKCRDVEKAINSADNLPASCKEMLTGMVQSSLTVFAVDRHRYQVQAVEMLKETLVAVQNQMQNDVAQAQAKVDSSDREKASRSSALEQAQANLTRIEQNATTGAEAKENDKVALATAKANLAAAQAAIEAAEGEVASMADQKSKLETAMKDIWEPFKTAKASGHDGNRKLKTLETVFTEVGLEAGLIDSLPETLKKDPESRGTFDGLVLKHVDAQTQQYLTKNERTIQEADQNKAKLTNAKAAAEAAQSAAQEKLTASSATLQEAEASLKESKAAVKAAQVAVDSFDKEMASVGGSIDSQIEKCKQFTEGALASFTALKDLAPPPEPEPEAVQEPPAAEAAAPEAVA